ncbi:MAG: NAD(P)/FAD-dependent oxidoreductase [Candidatus Omnitrophica bacterium]|nr:NAD(P)/FAD-dependent oxidoreductase [Candidatus Omnitrophota bacterium]
MEQKHLVVIGNGMAGMACVDQILNRKPNFKITVLSEEPYYNYNRILLSSVLAGEKTVDEIYINSKEWYDRHGINLCRGTRAVDVDSKNKTVIAADGSSVPYDLLLLATGSNPFIPPIEGVNIPGVFTFRNMADTENILESCKTAKKAIVIGGGLLGLEAARGIMNQGVKVSVVHIMDRLMEVQLDEVGGGFLKREIEKLGINVLLNKNTAKIMGEKQAEGVLFKDGFIEQADMVVIACGIRPSVELGKKAGLQVGRGIVVNDYMETSDPSIFAVGECVEHQGKVYGLVAPLYDQGKVLAATITGDRGPVYEGSVLATKLKVMGIELFSAGDFKAAESDKEVVCFQDHGLGIYKKIVIHQDRVVGTILIGDASDANRLLEMMRSKERIGDKRKNLLFSGPIAIGAPSDVMSRPDTDTICGCIGVSKGQIITAIQQKGLKTVSDVKACTKASSGCGTCAGLVQQILIGVVGSEFQEEKKDVLCACVPFPKEQLRTMIETQKLKSAQDVLDIYGNGTGCSYCKPALSFIVDEVHCGDHKEDRSARFINDRVHANIQRDGTFSVIPRMRGGVTSPEQLRKIADVAEKYKVPMVKVTGSQRIDLLGVKKEDLPKMWADLDMTSGYAYAKAVRMVKSCVGTDFCRYGTQDSIATGIELETLLEGLYTPAKVKMGVVGCPRNCAEATVKDIGLIGMEGGWQVVIGGAAGKIVRAADILVTVKTKEEALEAAMLFFQYYREHGEYIERTYDFVVRIGLEKIRRETILAPEEIRKGLLERLNKARAKAVNPWAVESKKPVHPMQFKDFVLPKDKEALIETGAGGAR